MYQEKEIGTYLLAGVFAGFVIVLLNGIIFFSLGSDGVYSVGAGLLNPFALMYGSMLPPVVTAFMLNYISKLKGGVWIFVTIMTALSIWVMSFVSGNKFADYAPFAIEVKQLLSVMVIICCAGNLALPLIARNKKIMSKLI